MDCSLLAASAAGSTSASEPACSCRRLGLRGKRFLRGSGDPRSGSAWKCGRRVLAGRWISVSFPLADSRAWIASGGVVRCRARLRCLG